MVNVMKFSIIHLTDIHMKGKIDNYICSRTESIIRAINSVLLSGEVAIIVVSGDIAFSGQKDEYQIAKKFLNEIKAGVDIAKGVDCSLLMVPGNHDCDFSSPTPIRNRLMPQSNADSNIEPEVFAEVSVVQNNFFDFSNTYSCPLDKDHFCATYELICDSGKILFLLMNSAWMSQREEKPGTLFVPCNLLPEASGEEYDCVFTILHHPYGWLNPDNAASLISYIRQTTDVLLLGHEHRQDSFQASNGKWTVEDYRGRELQGDNANESGFAVYHFDLTLNGITTYTFTWDSGQNQYVRTETDNIFVRNSLSNSAVLNPNKEYLQLILDPGMIINHFEIEDIHLPDIFCWPYLERIEMEEKSSITGGNLFQERVPETLLSSQLSIIIGESLTGRTSMAKMLFHNFLQRNECCLLCGGNRLTTHNEKNLRNIMDKIFEEEYSKEQLETFRQLTLEQRILIIDDFQDIPYHDERRSAVLSCLLTYFGHVIAFSDSSLDMQVICSKITHSIELVTEMYEILPFGNQKRQELVKKWYYLGNEYARGDQQIEARIDQTCDKIDMLLGGSNGIVPALPIYLIDILQNIDSVAPASYAGSQYGFLYESLINKCLSTIGKRYRNPGDINIDITVLSLLAFRMLKNQKRSFSETELLEVVSAFETRKKVAVNAGAIIEKMLAAKILKETSPKTYIYRYPYIFYYFTGRYIAYNLDESDVKAQLEYMSDRLYNESFGNIIIFTCHFANSVDIIENILLRAYISFDEYEPFDFNKHRNFFQRAQEKIDQALLPKEIGSDSDVDVNRQYELTQRDEKGIQDGTVREPMELTDEMALKESTLASVSSAMRIMDVLGQVLRNYPGDIDGELKLQIIDEIHKLGMRTMEVLFSTMGILEEDLILYISEQAKKKVNPNIRAEVVQKTREFLSVMMAGATRGMIHKIATCFQNEALLPAIHETFSVKNSLSQELILQDLNFNLLKRPDVESVLIFKKGLERNNEHFPRTILQSIVAQYLRHNHCSRETRQRLCAGFQFADDRVFVERQKSRELL